MGLASTSFDSPVGRLTLVAGDRGLVAVLWPDDRPGRVPLETVTDTAHHPVLVQTASELDAYFAGRRTVFSVPLDFRGTAFQKAVWAALLTIPFGERRTYGQIADQLGQPTASRAVGAANGRNPISIIAPCHRVVGAQGQLTGFAGGLSAKAFLLDHEAGQA